jgi:cell division protein FtsQ
MRSLNAAAAQPRSRGRANASRRAPPRVAADRPAFGKRKNFRTDPISRLLRAVKNAFNPRRPKFALTIVVFLIAAFAGLLVTGTIHRAAAAVDGAINTVVADAGFRIATVPLTGVRYADPDQISDKLGFRAGDSIFGIDPQAARQNLLTLEWVKDATVAVRYPDSVAVHIVEKTPFALWQSDHGLFAVDRDGKPIAIVEAARFKHLPLFFGDAPEDASDLVEAIGTHRAVAARVKAMQRVSGRRWNLVLDDGVLVKLPEDNWGRELGTLEHLIVDRGVLERDIAEIDLRLHDNYFFVLRHPAPPRKSSRGEPT